jgi:hypothetical protein
MRVPEHAEEPSSRPQAARVVLTVALLLLGLAAFGLWRVLSGSEDLPFAKGATPPSTVSVTSGHVYSLAVPGGVSAMRDSGVPLRADGSALVLECRYTTPGEPGTVPLTVTPEGPGTKYETTVGTFVAPVTGRIHVDCSSWGAMFVPNSDDHSTDFSGWALLASIVLLTFGAALAMAQIRAAMLRSTRAARGQDEIEANVDVPVGRRRDREVAGPDRGDVGA